MPNAWFRLYSELVSDRKVDRIATLLGVERATVIGVWAGILCLANDSPERGRLCIASAVPLTLVEIADAVGTSLPQLERMLERFKSLHMIECDGDTLVVSHWVGRQFESDSSTERVRLHRQHKARAETPTAMPEPTAAETLPQRFGNVSPHRFGNGPESESETETETETETDLTPANAGAPSGARSFPDWQDVVKNAAPKERPERVREFIAAHFPHHELPDYGHIGSTARVVGSYGRLLDLLWQQVPRPPTGDLLAYVQSIASHRPRGRDSPRHSGSEPIPMKRTIADIPQGWLQESEDEDGDTISPETPN